MNTTSEKWLAKAAEIYCESTGKTIAVIPGQRCDEPASANAYLIAAAPDLLQACQCMVDAWGQCECVDKSKPNHCPWCIARAAIAKSEGKTL